MNTLSLLARRLGAHQLGWPGWTGVLLLGAAAATAWGLRPALVAAQQDLLHQYVARLDTMSPAATRRAQPDPRDAARDAWPASGQVADTLARLAAVGGNGVQNLSLGAPVVEAVAPALLRVRSAMQFSAPYADARGLLATVLNTIPNASLDELSLERQHDADPVLRCRVSWSLYFRQDGP